MTLYPPTLTRWPFVTRPRPEGRSLTVSVDSFEDDSAGVVLPTTVCHQGGLRPGDEVEIYVQNSDTGKELVIRRCPS